MTHGDNVPSRSRLRDDRTLLHEEGACLPLRSRHGQCRACAGACPVGALTVSVDGLSLADACMGCGRCTAACPTQALALPEMAPAEAALPKPLPSPLRVECRKVPRESLAADSWVLPCLGALTAGHLMGCSASGVEVQVVDRGWCRGCDAGSPGDEGAHPSDAAVATARLWLQAVSSPVLPTLVAEPLPIAQRPATLPPAASEGPKLDRRSFFRDAIRRPAGRAQPGAVPMGGDGRAAYPADRRAPSPERVRQLAALTAIAGQQGVAVPAEVYPRLTVDASCCDQRLCVALCPTAALAARPTPDGADLEWSAERCISCGTCTRACPTGAVHLEPRGGEAGTRVLATHRRQRCTCCGETFTPPAEQHASAAAPVCPLCAKSRRFMDDARRQLFGAMN